MRDRPVFASRLSFIAPAGHNKHGKPLGLFVCECGRKKVLIRTEVRTNRVKSCGCLPREATAAFSKARSYSRRRIADRFWEKVDKHGPIVRPELGACWAWTGSMRAGRGTFMVRSLRRQKTANGTRKSIFIVASRMAWRLSKGAIGSKLVLHKCDNGNCCNPDHLFLGTQLDNMRDMRSKGRGASGTKTRHIGSAHGRAKLDEADIMEIRGLVRSGMARAAVARMFSVSSSTVERIIKGDTWKHVRGMRAAAPLSR